MVDALAVEHVMPFYEDQAAIDYARLAMLRDTIFGLRRPSPAAAMQRAWPGHLCPAPHGGAVRPAAFRAFWKIMGMMCHPHEVCSDPAVVAGTREILQRRGSGLIMAQPDQAHLLAALNGRRRPPGS